MAHASEPAGGPASAAASGPAGAVGTPASGEAAAGNDGGHARISSGRLLAVMFLAPALVVLIALVVYPIAYTVVRSFFNDNGTAFVGVDNYLEMFDSKQILKSITNNIIWVVVAPTLVTVLGLVYAVLTERIRWATAFKFLVFMPMAISFLAAGVTFRLVYEQSPDQGIANAIVVSIHDTFAEPAVYPKARPRNDDVLVKEGGDYQTKTTVTPGDTVLMPLVGVQAEDQPKPGEPAASTVDGEALVGVVWFDFTKGGGGKPNVVDPKEVGLPGVRVEAVDSTGKVVGTTETDAQGRFTFPELTKGEYTLRLPASNFAEKYNGISWLGPTWVTPSIIVAYIWIWAGFAMVLIAAGLAAIPRDALEAARVDGGTEWQVFRRVTVPLLRPVLIVVLVTLMINVLKIFDLVYIIPPESTRDDASVIAYEMWNVSFNVRDLGLGSALSVLLFILVLPAMLSNVRRLRRDQ